MRALIPLLLALSPAALADDAAKAADELYVTSEVLGQGSDESARRMETMLRADPAPLLACRADHLTEAPDALRFVQVEARLGTDGSVRKTKVTTSSGAPSIDACAASRIGAVRYDPPPMFPDRIQVNVTWSDPTKKKDAAAP